MKISKPTKIALAVLIIAIIAGVAYSVTMTPQPTAPPKPQPEQPKLTKVTFILNFGAIGGPQAPWFVAFDKGFFREQGLDVEIIPGRSSPYAVTQVAAEKADFGQATADVMMAARVNADTPVKIVYQLYQQDPNCIAAPVGLGLKKLEDISGKTLKLGAILGSSRDITWDIVAKKLGLDVSKITKVGIGFDDIGPISSGQIDLVQTWDDGIPIFQGAGIKMDYFFYRDYGINYPSLAIITTDKMIKEKPEIVRKFLAAAHKAFQYSSDHPGEVVDITMRYSAYNLPKNTVQFYGQLQIAIADMKGSKPGQTLGKIDAQALSDLQDLLLQYNKINKKLPINDYFTDQFVPK